MRLNAVSYKVKTSVALMVTDTLYATADFHIFIRIIINRHPFTAYANLTGFAL